MIQQTTNAVYIRCDKCGKRRNMQRVPCLLPEGWGHRISVSGEPRHECPACKEVRK